MSPLRKVAVEMREMLSEHPEGIMFPQIVPQYKEKYGRQFTPSEYGMSKMIQVLEAIPDVVKVCASMCVCQESIKGRACNSNGTCSHDEILSSY